MKASMFFISMSTVFSTISSNILKVMSGWTNVVKQSPDKYVNFCQQASDKIILFFFFSLKVLFLLKSFESWAW